MKNALKSLFIVALTLVSLTMYGEKMYVVSGKCNVPLAAGMNSSKYQLFTWDGSTAAVTTDITCSVTGTGGSYYNSTSLALNDIKTLSNYNASSSSARTMQAIKLGGNTTMTISLGNKTMSKVIVVGRANSTDNLTITILGEDKNTKSKDFFVVEKEQTFSGSIDIANTTSKEYHFFVYMIEGTAGPVAVTGVTLDKSTLSIEAGQTATLTATVAPANADNKNVTWSSNNTTVASVDQTGKITANSTGTATITVTTEDGNKTATCTVTVTAPAAPVAVTGVSLNKSYTNIYVGGTETLVATIAPADATNKALTWTSSDPDKATVNNGVVTGVAVGASIITVTTADGGFTATCSVTVDPAPTIDVTGVTLNKSTLSLQIGGSETLTATVAPDNASNKNITWSSSAPAIAGVDQTGKVTAVAAGSATITVTTEDGDKKATCAVTVTAGPPVPQTGLTLHLPEIYEAKEIAGGYNGTLRVVGGREYEVYYTGKTSGGEPSVCVRPNTQKQDGITINGSTSVKANDGWFEGAINGGVSNVNLTENAEFEAGATNAYHKMTNGDTYTFHVKGFDQFSFLGKDKKTDTSSKQDKPQNNQLFEVYVDDVLQAAQTNTSAITLRRYDITTGEHVIRVKAINGGNSEFYGFSLRIAEEPRTKWLKGNDSTQVVMQTSAPRPVHYFTKYNSKGETKLEWIGNEATGLTLTVQNSGPIGDTLVLGGQALCPVGTYSYRVVSYMSGRETSAVTGKLSVASDLKAQTDTIIDAYQGEEMDEIRFAYYALSAEAVTLTWTGQTPAGISGSGNNGKYIISGTPTSVGSYPFTVSVQGGPSIKGKITVKPLDLGNNPVMYLYKNNLAYEKDGVYTYLKSQGKNLIERKAKEELRSADQYAKYKWIIISEDVDADNPEVLAIARGEVNLPVLNMKSFTYSPGRLDWGEPDNGSLTKEKGRFLTVLRDDHPIFRALGKKKGNTIQMLDTVIVHGLMPARVDYDGTLCLATAWTRNIEDYFGDGKEETFIHEVPANMRGGQKYICLPIAMSSSGRLTADGKKVIKAAVDYLLSSDATVAVPQLAITRFTVNGVPGVINEEEGTILVSLDEKRFADVDLTQITPEITLASTYSHVTPASGETVDFSHSGWSPIVYEVSDYVNRRSYEVIVRLYDPEGIEEVYTVGEWVNIYDIYGRKIATTNEDIYTMALPHGIYLIVTENGNTIKITR